MLTLRGKSSFNVLIEGHFDLTDQNSTETSPSREQFLEKYRETILDWTKTHKLELIDGRKNYSWKDKDPQSCLTARDRIRRSITFSQSQNNGGIDLETLDLIMKWGGLPKFPLRDESKILEITRKVFSLVDKGDVSDAINKLLSIDGVDIEQASRIIGLFDQNRFCIYNNIVGNAIKSLEFKEKPVLQCPTGPHNPEHICSDQRWGENYQRLIWTLEVIRDYLNKEGYPFSIADIEMALFMMGK